MSDLAFKPATELAGLISQKALGARELLDHYAERIERLNPAGLNLTEDNFRLGSETGTVAWEMAKYGLGVAVMSDEVAALTPGMERVLPQMEPFTFPVWLTAHRELHTSRRIRLVFDLLAGHLAKTIGQGNKKES